MRPADVYTAERRNPLVRSPTGGRVLSAMMLPWFALAPPAGFGVLTTVGRRTGKARPRCMRVIRDGDRAYLISIPGEHAAWLKNIRANPEVRLRIKGGKFRGRARELTDPDEVRAAMDTYRGSIHFTDYMACGLHRRGWPTREKIKQLHQTWLTHGVPVVVELEAIR